MNHEGSTFLSGCPAVDWFAFFSKEADEMAASGQTNSSFFSYNEKDPDAQFRKYDASVGWAAVAMATIKPQATGKRDVVAVSPQGDFWELDPTTTAPYLGKMQQLRGHIRNLAVISDAIYGCGMGRMALLRESRGQWRDFGPPDTQSADVIGFEGIDGFGPTDIYAAGWEGEIWHYGPKGWRQIDSPVSAILSAVCCGEDGAVYIVGHDGTMLRGRDDQWEVVETGRTENLMDVKTFDGKVYVSTNFSILVLTEGGLVHEEDFSGGDRPATCMKLLRGPGVLFSMGPKDWWTKKSGSSWTRIV